MRFEWQAIYAIAQFGQTNNTQINAIFIHFGKPCDDTGIRVRLHPFGDHICIQQEAHKSISRGFSGERSTRR